MEYILFKGEFVGTRIIYIIFNKHNQLKQVSEFLRVLINYSQAHIQTYEAQAHTCAHW